MSEEKSIPVIRDRQSLQKLPRGPKTSLVITSGGLHAGHAAVIAEAAKDGYDVIVSVFDPASLSDINHAFDDTEVGAEERGLVADVACAAQAGATAVFAPSADALFPFGSPRIFIELPDLVSAIAQMRKLDFNDDAANEFLATKSELLGVYALLYTKFLNLVRPDRVVAGQNDIVRLAALRHVLRDLDYEIDIVTVPTHRDSDGLATANSNLQLSASGREQALAVYQALRAGVQTAAAMAPVPQVLDSVWEQLQAVSGLQIEYVALVDPVTLGPLEGEPIATGTLAIAANVEGVELTDSALVMIRKGYSH